MSTSNDDEETKNALASVLRILLSDTPHGDGEGERLTQWMDDLKQHVKPTDPLYVSDKYANSSANSLPKLFTLLRDCLLSHRWAEVVEVMAAIAKEPGNNEGTLLKVGLEVFQQIPGDNSALLEKLIGQLKCLPSMNPKEVVLEHVLVLIHEKRFKDALQAFQWVPPKKRTKKLSWREVERTQYIDLLYRAYRGLVYYAEWLNARQRLDDMRADMEDTQLLQLTDRLSMEEEQIQGLSSRAITHLNVLVGQPGVWDIFVTKHVELLEFYGNTERAQEVLVDYAAKNVANINAHKYLYHFCLRHGGDREEKIEALQAVCHVSPSDELVLDLHSLYLDTGVATLESVRLLFDMLDFACWQNIDKPWSRLAAQLTEIYQGRLKADLDAVEECWNIRDTWWPSYHFTASQCDNKDRSLLLNKAVVATFLLGEDNSFTKLSCEVLTDAYDQRRLRECSDLKGQT